MSNNQSSVSCNNCGNTNNTSAPKPCGATTTACGSCVPTCHWDVETYQELSDNRSKYAGTYVTVREEGNAVYVETDKALMAELADENEPAPGK